MVCPGAFLIAFLSKYFRKNFLEILVVTLVVQHLSLSPKAMRGLS